jgi:RimJ/RimL family protein N-acetyltransferase
VLAVGTVNGEVVGFYALAFPLKENTHLIYVNVRVAAAHRGNGYGRALTAAMHERAVRPGRTTLVGSTFHTAAQLEAVTDGISPTSGSGVIPTDDSSARLAIESGYELGLVNRASVSLIRDVDLASLRAQAEAEAGGDYSLVQWHGPTGLQHRDEVANLYNRMSVDAPAGGLDFQEESWTAESIAAMEQVVVDEGREQWVTAVDFAGTLVAFTVLYLEDGAPKVADQEETLVFSEHRGRALGLLIKTANAQYLLEHKSEVERIITWNAAENEHMLAINEAVGFRFLGASGNWQKVLAQ